MIGAVVECSAAAIASNIAKLPLLLERACNPRSRNFDGGRAVLRRCAPEERAPWFGAEEKRVALFRSLRVLIHPAFGKACQRVICLLLFR
jgi:hypothetical protein